MAAVDRQRTNNTNDFLYRIYQRVDDLRQVEFKKALALKREERNDRLIVRTIQAS